MVTIVHSTRSVLCYTYNWYHFDLYRIPNASCSHKWLRRATGRNRFSCRPIGYIPRHFENNTTKYVHPLSPWGELWPLHFVVSWLCCYELGSYVGGLRHPRDLKNVFKFAKPLSFIGIVKRTRFSKLGVRNKACLPVKSRWLPQRTGVLSQATG